MNFSQQNIQKIRQIFHHRPVRHFKTDLANLQNGDHAICELRIIRTMFFQGKKGIKILTTECKTRKFIDILFFHGRTGYIHNLFPTNSTRIVEGKVQIFNGKIQFTHPSIIKESDIDKINKIQYENANPENEINLRTIFNQIDEITEWIDNQTLEKFAFPSFKTALEHHFFNNNTNSNALFRLAYDEIFAFQLSLLIMEKKTKNFPIKSTKFAQKMIQNLPFELTNDQQTVLKEIENDQRSANQMIRLLQGDVGSGKTIVALCAILQTAENGGQAVLLAPTESLVKQHFEYIKNALADANLHEISCGILVSEMKIKDKRETILQLKNGDLQIIVGTHALFYDQVEFANLQFIVIDEQQRFGVLQRLRLAEKGLNPDVLLLTATPIPRTEMIAKYRHIESSLIKEKPKDRLPIKTSMRSLAHVEKIISRLKIVIEKEKIFWVCPLIEESDFFNLANIKKRFEELERHFGNKIGLIHGKMKNRDIQLEIEKFRQNERKILVATSIIEVGIHVPDASIIIIENAERFGLSSLHQLRGRVGRGKKQSFCVLLHAENISKTGARRLQTMCNSNDGFHIAREDLKIRGAGEIFGQMQSGQQEFLFFDAGKHQKLLQLAMKNVQQHKIDPKMRDFLLQIFGFESCVYY